MVYLSKKEQTLIYSLLNSKDAIGIYDKHAEYFTITCKSCHANIGSNPHHEDCSYLKIIKKIDDEKNKDKKIKRNSIKAVQIKNRLKEMEI